MRRGSSVRRGNEKNVASRAKAAVPLRAHRQVRQAVRRRHRAAVALARRIANPRPIPPAQVPARPVRRVQAPRPPGPHRIRRPLTHRLRARHLPVRLRNHPQARRRVRPAQVLVPRPAHRVPVPHQVRRPPVPHRAPRPNRPARHLQVLLPAVCRFPVHRRPAARLRVPVRVRLRR